MKGWLSRSLAVLVLLLAAAPAGAHVGSPNVFYDGTAGPYPLRVIVRPPLVIPGLAEVTVKLGEAKASAVTVQPIQWKAGLRGAPPPDVAVPVPGAPGVWSAQLWLMVGSSYGVRVHVQGPAGTGEVLVPVTAVPSQVLGMKKGMGAVLAALGLFLFAGAVTLVVAGARESSLPPGEVPDARRRRKARVMGGVFAILLALALWQGRVWWNSVDAQVRNNLYKPFHIRTAVTLETGRPVLDLAIADERRDQWSPLMPDHGKLMHLFLLREPGLDTFAHLHPMQQQDEGDFKVALPPLPAGRYRLYADVVHESGFPQTLVDTVTIPESGVGSQAATLISPDPDDSWHAAEPLAARTSPGPKIATLGDGETMLWNQEPLVANRETTLRFEARDAEGHPLPLKPYMGMLSHAVITRDDGKVFIHLHPMGTISMAAQESFEKKTGMAEVPAMDHASMPGMNQAPSVLSFPYEFPQPGRYRLWVQVKSGGQVRTGVFDAEVGKAETAQ
ncbi:MAG: hypothetical protein WAM82_25825 [Thermoanaerobaculia bacterium]